MFLDTHRWPRHHLLLPAEDKPSSRRLPGHHGLCDEHWQDQGQALHHLHHSWTSHDCQVWGLARYQNEVWIIQIEYNYLERFHFRLSPAGTVPPCLSKKSDSLCSAVGDAAAQAIRGVQLDIKTDAIKNFPVFKRTVFQNNTQKKLQVRCWSNLTWLSNLYDI